MQISVSGMNMDMGNAFQEHAQTSLNAIVEKYFEIEFLGRSGGLKIIILRLQNYMGVRNRTPWTGVT